MTAAIGANASEATTRKDDSWIEIVRRQVGSLHFGAVQIVVHEGRVVQIERSEKVRLDRPHCDLSR